jgi:hypothetical protein
MVHCLATQHPWLLCRRWVGENVGAGVGLLVDAQCASCCRRNLLLVEVGVLLVEVGVLLVEVGVLLVEAGVSCLG